ncbi:MAG TPA: hypothetical protein VKE51_30415 [Vicinamibacterales bacterium]|nr:hypothetical protein [Vicinamibacterales bacterium]
MRNLSGMQAVVYGGLLVGVLDAIDAVVFFGLRGATPVRVFQGIAAGLLGRASVQGGLRTALLGLAIHFFIAFSIVATYYLASRSLPVLVRRPVLCGALYGVFVYFFMNRIVIPLSAIGVSTFSLAVFVNGIAIHILGIGMPAALLVARAPAPLSPAAGAASHVRS